MKGRGDVKKLDEVFIEIRQFCSFMFVNFNHLPVYRYVIYLVHEKLATEFRNYLRQNAMGGVNVICWSV